MAVDLGDYIESLQREVNPPGANVFTAATEDDWLGYLADAFWEARMDGFMAGYEADSDGVVTPLTGTTDLPRQYVALIVLYAGVRILRTQILNTRTGFRAKAGPVEFEQQNSATMLAEMLKQLAAAKTTLQQQIQDQTPVYAWDTLVNRVLGAYEPIYLPGR